MSIQPEPLRHASPRRIAIVAVLLAIGFLFLRGGRLIAQTETPADNPAISESAAPTAATQPVASVPARPSPRDYFGLWSLAPALVAIGLAVITQQVIPALSLGILTAAILMCIHGGDHNPINMLIYAIQHYLLGVFIPPAHSNIDRIKDGYNRLHVIVFTQFIGGMIGIIEANGGTRAMVARVTHLMRTRRRGQLGALGGGILIFFDDYANALILGPAMRPVFDRLRLSRAKLAYIVDSTAAPVASIFIGTWLAAEINYLDGAISGLGESRPAFLEGMTGTTAFWGSLPYRTYAWLALCFVFLIGLTGRDFGPMRRAEREALTGAGPAAAPGDQAEAENGKHWFLGFLPVFTLVAMTVTLLLVTGRQGCDAAGIAVGFASWAEIKKSIMDMLGKADSYTALLYSGLTAVTLAAIATVASKRLTLSKTMSAMTTGMQRIFGAQIVLILAWGLSTSTQDLELGQAATVFLQDKVDRGLFAIPLLPTVIFLTACIVSFSTGTSWGTMGILCPTAVAIAANLLAGLPTEQAMPLFYASIGAVLTGAVFGDHCSPISDTTVLSAMATECDLTQHVRTQLPYALIVAIVGLLCTDILDFGLIRWNPDFYNRYWTVYYGTAIAVVVLFFILLLIGRRPKGLVVEPAVEMNV